MHKKNKIYYQSSGKSNYPFSGEFGFEPHTRYSQYDSDCIYYDCPAWSHKAKRSFIIRSPIDINLNITPVRTQDGLIDYVLRSPTLRSDFLNEYIILDHNWCNEKRATIQITLPMLHFWTEEKNIWLEVRPLPQTAVKNNIITVGGWFNVSAWSRPISFAFDLVNNEKAVNIKRGDPIYEICFYSSNMNDEFTIEQKNIPEKMEEGIRDRLNLKYFQRGLSVKYMFGQKEKESKCPFSFMWKK